MRPMLSRPGRLLLPALLAVFGGRDVAVAMITAQICSLCAGAALRAAGGRVVNAARMRGNYLLALAMALTGGGAAVWLCTALMGISLFSAGAGALACVCMLCSDRLAAASDGTSATMCECVAALLTGAGVAAGGGMPVLVAAAVSAAICLVISFISGGIRPVRPGFALMGCVPGALARSGITAGCFGLMMYLAPAGAPFYMASWGLVSALETPFRRDASESVWPRAALTAACAGAAVAAAFIAGGYPHQAAHIAAAAFMAVTAGALFFLDISPRAALIALCATACAAAAWLAASGYLPAGPAVGAASSALGAAALAMTFPDAIRRARALRLSRRARR